MVFPRMYTSGSFQNRSPSCRRDEAEMGQTSVVSKPWDFGYVSPAPMAMSEVMGADCRCGTAAAAPTRARVCVYGTRRLGIAW